MLIPDTPTLFHLHPSRVHEVQGGGRLPFAIWQMSRHANAVWIRPAGDAWLPVLNGAPWKTRMRLVRAPTEKDILWATEEALRGLPGAIVIAQPEKPLSLTAGRRLQLAAEAGGTTGLLLIREGAGSPATETRWNCEPVASQGDSTLHRWSLIKNKKGTTGDWTLDWNGTSAAFDMVSATGQRDCPAALAR